MNPGVSMLISSVIKVKSEEVALRSLRNAPELVRCFSGAEEEKHEPRDRIGDSGKSLAPRISQVKL